MQKITISIVTYNNEHTVEECLDSVFRISSDVEINVKVVDNASQDGTVELIRRKFPSVELLLPGRNLGFGAGHNLVLRECTTTYVLMINPDASLCAGALIRMLERLEENQDVGAVGPRVEYKEGKPQVSFGQFPGLLNDLRQRRLVKACQRGNAWALGYLEKMLERPIYPDWISGSCLFVRMSDMISAGFFDERFFLFLEDVDLCRRMRLSGKKVMVEPQALCRHEEGHSHADSETMKNYFRLSRLIYENKHGSRAGFCLYRLFRGRGLKIKYDPGLKWRPGTAGEKSG